MCSYNAVNGVPSCANGIIQNEIVRSEWDFSGFIVSDCGAINTIMADHHYTNTTEETVQVALRAGTNLNCGQFYQKYAQDAYDKQYITTGDLAGALGPLFGLRMALGMFDPASTQPYLNISTDHINSPAHQALALDAARESIVLLQNDGSLPLSAQPSLKVAVIGPNSNATETMQGNYHGVAPYLISPLMGIQAMGVAVQWAFGCDVACPVSSGFAAAVAAAKTADVVVMVMGLDQGQEREGHDRDVLTLPGMQLGLMQQVQAATSGQPLVVVLMSGGPVDLSWAKSNANAILWTGYPGQSGGQAIAEVLFGGFNPSGRLPVTYYPADYVNQISFFDMSMRDPPGRTYKFYTGTPVFEFGSGLSYTTFSFVWSELPEGSTDEGLTLSCRELIGRGQVDYRVKVTNVGRTAGGVSALAFVSSEVKGGPLKELFGFQKVFLEPGESAELIFAAYSRVFHLVDSQGERTLTPGRYWIIVEDQRHLVTLV
jgi:hypothetical protein